MQGCNLYLNGNIQKSLFRIALIITMFLCADAFASGPEEDLRSSVEEIISLLNDPQYEGADRQAVLRDKVRLKTLEVFEYRMLARGALGRNWKRFSPDQRNRFSDLFAQLVFNTYFNRLDDVSGLNDVKISYLETVSLKDTRSGIKRARVKTSIHKDGKDISIDYSMLKTKGGLWKIYDVNIEGVGMVKNYRTQYSKMFQDSPETIIKKLEMKIDALKNKKYSG